MASIGEMTIAGQERRDDGTWLFTIRYTARFTDTDLGHRFDDSVAIRELHGQSRIAESHNAVTFTATSLEVLRKKRIVVSWAAVRGAAVRGAAIEAVCAEVCLRQAPAQPLRC